MRLLLGIFVQILPQRIREWKLSGCTAEANDTKKLEKIRRQQLQAQAELQRLEIKYQVRIRDTEVVASSLSGLVR